jgi:Right handed beta helix region
VVALDYEIVEGTEAANAYFYMCAHSGHLGYGADKWERWRGETGAKGMAKLRISATVDDFVIIVGICNRGAIRIQNLKVLHGSGWTTVPLESASGNAQPPAPPTGAQPLTVDPPANPNGPILDLADFGAVPDGDSLPSSGPDQNHAAFVAAIAKCREVKIRNGDFSPTGFTGKLQAATPDYKNNETTLVFNQELPPHIAFDAILFNLRYGSRNCIIRNCHFHENRAHAILCQTADWLIEGNRFFHNQYPAIAVQADTGRWCVGFGARNVIIRENKFESANPSGGAVVYVSVDINGSPSRYPLLENILFENNVFQEMTGPAIEAASFKNLVISNNTFINREKAPIAVKMRGSIRAKLGSGLWVEGNEWTTQKGLASPSLFYDADTTQKIVCKSNLLKN